MTGQRLFRMEFHGKSATATVDPEGQCSLALDGKLVEAKHSQEWGTTGGAAGNDPGHWQGFWHENRHFVDCLHSGQQPISNFADAAKTMDLVEQIIQIGSQP